MALLDYRRSAVPRLGVLGVLACGVAAAADPNLYFGAKGGIMASDRNGFGDSWNAGALVGLHFMDFGSGKSHYGSLSGEIEGTEPVINGDLDPVNGKQRGAKPRPACPSPS